MLRRHCEWSIAEPRTHCEETDGAGGLGARQYYSTPYRYYSSIDGLLNRRCYAVGANRPGRPLVAERSNRRPTTRRDVRVLGTLSGTHSPCEVRRDKLSPLVVSVLRLVPEVQVLDHLNTIQYAHRVLYAAWASTAAQRKHKYDCHTALQSYSSCSTHSLARGLGEQVQQSHGSDSSCDCDTVASAGGALADSA